MISPTGNTFEFFSPKDLSKLAVGDLIRCMIIPSECEKKSFYIDTYVDFTNNKSIVRLRNVLNSKVTITIDTKRYSNSLYSIKYNDKLGNSYSLHLWSVSPLFDDL